MELGKMSFISGLMDKTLIFKKKDIIKSTFQRMISDTEINENFKPLNLVINNKVNCIDIIRKIHTEYRQ